MRPYIITAAVFLYTMLVTLIVVFMWIPGLLLRLIGEALISGGDIVAKLASKALDRV